MIREFFDDLPVPLPIGKRLRVKRLVKAAKYYRVKPESVISCSSWASTLVFLVVLTLLSSLAHRSILHLWLTVTVSVAVSTIVFLRILNHLPNRLEGERLTITTYVPAILHEVYFVLSSGGSIEDVLLTVGTGGYPYVSKPLLHILKRSLNGEDPYGLVQIYLKRQPSEVLRNGCKEILLAKRMDNSAAIGTIESTSHKVQGFFKKFLSQLEDRVAVLLAFTHFSPIIFIFLMSAVDLTAWGQELVLIVPIFTLIADALYGSLLRVNVKLLG